MPSTHASELDIDTGPTESFMSPEQRYNGAFKYPLASTVFEEPLDKAALEDKYGKLHIEDLERLVENQADFEATLEEIMSKGKEAKIGRVMLSAAYEGKAGEAALYALDQIKRSRVAMMDVKDDVFKKAETGKPVLWKDAGHVHVRNMELGIGGHPEAGKIKVSGDFGRLSSTYSRGNPGIGMDMQTSPKNLEVHLCMPGCKAGVVRENPNGWMPDIEDQDDTRYMSVQSVEGEGPFVRQLLEIAAERYGKPQS